MVFDYLMYLIVGILLIFILYILCRTCSSAIFRSYFEIKKKFNSKQGGSDNEDR